jgi:hypothetical protein
MKHAFEVDSVAMIYIPSLIKIGSSIQKLLEDAQTHKQEVWRSHKRTLSKLLLGVEFWSFRS